MKVPRRVMPSSTASLREGETVECISRHDGLNFPSECVLIGAKKN